MATRCPSYGQQVTIVIQVAVVAWLVHIADEVHHEF